MKQIDQYRYEVSEREKISIRVTPRSGSSWVQASLDGESLIGEENTFHFTASKPKGDHHDVALLFYFLPDGPEKYEVELTGSEGGTFSWSVLKSNPSKTEQISFYIGDTGPKIR